MNEAEHAHLIAGELFDELHALGFRIGPGDLGKNITSRAIDLLNLPPCPLKPLMPF